MTMAVVRLVLLPWMVMSDQFKDALYGPSDCPSCGRSMKP